MLYAVAMNLIPLVVLAVTIFTPPNSEIEFATATAQFLPSGFIWLVLGALVNPINGLALIWLVRVIYYQDTAKGQAKSLTFSPRKSKLLTKLRWPLVAMGAGDLLIVLLTLPFGISSNPADGGAGTFTLTFALFPLLVTLVFLALRALFKRKTANA